MALSFALYIVGSMGLGCALSADLPFPERLCACQELLRPLKTVVLIYSSGDISGSKRQASSCARSLLVSLGPGFVLAKLVVLCLLVSLH